MTAVLDTTINAAASGTALTVAGVAGMADTYVGLMIATVNANTTIADNNGGRPFTEDLNDLFDAGGSHVLSIFSRRYATGDAAALTTLALTGGSSTRWCVVGIGISDPHASTIYDVAPAAGTNCIFQTASNDHVAPDITTLTANAIHIVGIAPDGDTVTVDTSNVSANGYTIHENGGNQNLTVASKVIVTPGATGGQYFISGAVSTSLKFSFAIKAAAAGGNVNLLVGKFGPLLRGKFG